MFLDPLMLLLEESNRGYKLDEDTIISGGAYADDMVLHANKNFDLQLLMNDCANYFTYVGLSFSIDGTDKTVYTNNLIYNIYNIYIRDKNHNLVKIPYYKKSESYKYLGVWINLDLNWEKQQNVLSSTINKYITYLYKKCFNATQTIEIVNLVIFLTVTYRMNFAYFDKTLTNE